MPYTVVINDYKVLADTPQEVVALVSWTESLVHPKEEEKTVERKPPVPTFSGQEDPYAGEPVDRESAYVPHGVTNSQYQTWKAVEQFGEINGEQLSELLDISKVAAKSRLHDLYHNDHLIRVRRGVYRVRV